MCRTTKKTCFSLSICVYVSIHLFYTDLGILLFASTGKHTFKGTAENGPFFAGFTGEGSEQSQCFSVCIQQESIP